MSGVTPASTDIATTSALGPHPATLMNGRPWTRTDDWLVRTLPSTEAARRTGRTLYAVYRRRRQLHVAATKRRWTAAEDRVAWRVPPARAAAYLKRTRKSVEVRRSRLARRGGAAGD